MSNPSPPFVYCVLIDPTSGYPYKMLESNQSSAETQVAGYGPFPIVNSGVGCILADTTNGTILYR